MVLATALAMGVGPVVTAVGPWATAAHADPVTSSTTVTNSTTDPVLCFVAAQNVITEALKEFHSGQITIAHLRVVLVGTAVFLGDCLTPA